MRLQSTLVEGLRRVSPNKNIQQRSDLTVGVLIAAAALVPRVIFQMGPLRRNTSCWMSTSAL